ncbi:MAG TPA: hypothetical protein VH082_04840, partial [Rudaea sp.]|nr:hypothetical protein [Rudaea sp.]
VGHRDVILRGQRPMRTTKKRFLVTFCRLAKSYPLLAAEAVAFQKPKPPTPEMKMGAEAPIFIPRLSSRNQKRVVHNNSYST